MTTDEELDAYIRKISTAIHHAVGTSRMASRDSPTEGVVNPDLTVKGTHGLRVIDASIFVSPPYQPHVYSGLISIFIVDFLAVRDCCTYDGSGVHRSGAWGCVHQGVESWEDCRW